ncbi:MAG: UDP-N-acetylmuramate dehydrogenase [bacterium]|nr:UDP-N-acetylmuramate dehydrogenase [bacterium]
MSLIKEKVDLKPYNTFGIEARCDFFAEIRSEEEFLELIQSTVYKNNKKLIVGGGSNLLLTGDFKGLVIKNSIRGIKIVSEDEENVLVKVAAGEVWHEFVQWCIGREFAGVENLSLIPGCVGAGPMQNIGAYGVELKDVFVSLDAIGIYSAERRLFNREECKFGYRESVFKNEFKDQFLIVSVTFRLSKKPILNTSYGAINAELQAMKIVRPGIKEVSEAVINIRRSKLPDPSLMGNAGSFFKNPEVTAVTYNKLKSSYEGMVAYPLANGNFKLAAGWMIEQAGMKGFEWHGAAVHVKQALVLVNKNNCKGKDVLELSEIVIKKVFEKFEVRLEREVNVVA